MNAAARPTASAGLGRWAARHLGWPGVAGVLMWLAASTLAWGLRPSLVQSQQALLRQYVSRLDPAPAASSPAPAPQRDPRDAVRDGWPAASQASDTLAQLAAFGRRPEVGARQFRLGTPTRESMPPALLRVRVEMRFNARYAGARALLAGVLNTIPNAALDTVVLERGNLHDPLLRCRLSWSLYFRDVAP